MKVPIFEEVLLEKNDFISIMEVLMETDIGHAPVYIDLDNYDESEYDELLTNLLLALRSMQINPFFPYPVYIVTNKLPQHNSLPIIDSYDNFPLHFITKRKRLNNREVALLKKISILVEKTKNLAIKEKMASIQRPLSLQRNFLQTCKEVSFYTKVLNKVVQRDSFSGTD
ncbi:MAG: hypothetical protein ISR65_14785 [Bacteriovoracaceae bacterium]|nr:hypothetical protein [Bacteriovoracaceae bacterium]